jgi:hypothetical protein
VVIAFQAPAGPHRPDQIDLGIAHPGDRTDPKLDLAGHRFGDRTVRGGQRHRHHHAAIISHIDAVDQPEVVDVDRNLGVEDIPQRRDHRLVEVAAGLARGNLGRLLLEEAFKVVALALQLVGRRLLNNGPWRRRYAFNFFDHEFGFLVHPKILLVRSIPRSSAAISASSE